MGISLSKDTFLPLLPKLTRFLELLLTFLEVVVYRHKHAYVKTKCSSGDNNSGIRHIEQRS